MRSHLFFNFLLGIVFIFSTLIGIQLITPSSSDLDVSSLNNRKPAADHLLPYPQDEFSRKTVIQTILNKLQIHDYPQGYTEIKFPSLYLIDTDQKPFPFCEEFPQIIFIFEGEGLVINGEKPELELNWFCQYDEDGNTFVIHIPTKHFVNQKPSNEEFIFEEDRFSLKFFNLDQNWPSAWALSTLIIQDHSGHTQLEIEKKDIHQYLTKPIGFRWISN